VGRIQPKITRERTPGALRGRLGAVDRTNLTG
jgi:hypothetical protein